ncbi:MAG: formamidopyrimidine-DNA glycosylase, partial [Acidobacteriota bacterium]|nr:formamidopyrimidine-DNA glycosylase [Acidobacteriota bacterium]
MPELPEVEHVVRALRRAVVGQRILAADIKLPKLVGPSSTSGFSRKLKGSKIVGVNRRGKFILIQLDSDRVLVVHLRMTGKFLVLTP